VARKGTETEGIEHPKRVSDGVARRKEREEGGRQRGRRRWRRLGCVGQPLFAGYWARWGSEEEEMQGHGTLKRKEAECH